MYLASDEPGNAIGRSIGKDIMRYSKVVAMAFELHIGLPLNNCLVLHPMHCLMGNPLH